MTEKARTSGAEMDGVQIAERIGEVVDRGVDAAENIHRRLVAIPLDIVAPKDDLEAMHDLRRIQDRSLDVIYGAVRDVNHEIVGLAKTWMGGFQRAASKPAKRTAKKKPASTKPRDSVHAA